MRSIVFRVTEATSVVCCPHVGAKRSTNDSGTAASFPTLFAREIYIILGIFEPNVVSDMRLIGLLLLIVGVLLCASISWATIGFLSMGLGLICVQLPVRKLPASDAMVPAVEISRSQNLELAVSQASSAAPAEAADNSEGKFARAVGGDEDQDLVDVERILSRYGASYVDQFRKLYAVFDNKALLPSILQLLIESAKQEEHNARILARTPGSEEHNSGPSEYSQDWQPVEMADPISVPSQPRGPSMPSVSAEQALSQPGPPDLAVTLPETLNDTVRRGDVDDVASLTNIFERLNREKP